MSHDTEGVWKWQGLGRSFTSYLETVRIIGQLGFCLFLSNIKGAARCGGYQCLNGTRRCDPGPYQAALFLKRRGNWLSVISEQIILWTTVQSVLGWSFACISSCFSTSHQAVRGWDPRQLFTPSCMLPIWDLTYTERMTDAAHLLEEKVQDWA